MISMIYNLPLSLSQFSLVSNSAVSFHELWKNFTILYSGFCIFIFYLVSITLIPYVCVYYIMGISYAENSFKKLNIMKVIYIHICHFSYHTFVDIGVNLILASSVFDLRTAFNLLNAIISFSSSLFPLKPFWYNSYSLSNS